MNKKLLAILAIGGVLFQWQGVSCLGIPVAGNLPYQLTQGILNPTAANPLVQALAGLFGIN
jgi:hypothetical protein